MGVKNAPEKEGREASRKFRKEAAKEERKVEAEKGSDLKKGTARFEERAEKARGHRGVRPAG